MPRPTTRELPKLYEYTVTKNDLGRWIVLSSVAGGHPVKIHSCKSRREATTTARILAGRVGTVRFGKDQAQW